MARIWPRSFSLGLASVLFRAFLRISLQLHKWGRTMRRRREYRGAENAEVGGMWGGGVPLPLGDWAGKGLCTLSRKLFDFGSQYVEFWCILCGIFYSTATCFTRKTGVNWSPSPDLYYFFASKSIQASLI